jgi:pyrroline-5-carboxylate reductase
MEVLTKIGIIGLGTIGGLLAEKLVKSGDFEVIASTLHPERHKDVEEKGVKLLWSNRETAKEADVLIIAVKPRDVSKVLMEIRDEAKGKLIISVAAAVPLKIMERIAPRSRFIRTMPNITAKVDEAVTCISPGSNANRDDIELVKAIFDLMGESITIDEEAMDTVTGFVGSGPAYAFILIDALADAGVKVGLPKKMALRMAARTVLGSAKMILENQGHPGELKDMVVTPGGVTIMGLYELEKRSIRAALMEAVDAAVKKAKEITSQITGNEMVP